MNPTILVIEDYPITRKMIRVALQAEDFTVLEAGTAAEALANARRRKSRRPLLASAHTVLMSSRERKLSGALRKRPDPASAVVTVVLSSVNRSISVY